MDAVRVYKYLCVLDFEATCDGRFIDGRPDRNFTVKQEHEIIEFPSVLMEWDPVSCCYMYRDDYRCFCYPLEKPVLTEFCTALTGISQSDVDQGLDFPDVLAGHYTWLTSHVDSIENVAIVTCGFWDIGTMLPAECKRWAVLPPNNYFNFINIKKVFFDKLGAKFNLDGPKGMAGMLKIAAIPLEGHHHSGIDDCKNIAKLVQFVSAGVQFDSSLVRSIPTTEFKVTNLKKKIPFRQSFDRCARAIHRAGGIVRNEFLEGKKCNCGGDPSGHIYREIEPIKVTPMRITKIEYLRQFVINPACVACINKEH